MEKEPPIPAASMPMMFDSDRAASRLRDHSASATPSADRTAEKLRRIAASDEGSGRSISEDEGAEREDNRDLNGLHEECDQCLARQNGRARGGGGLETLPRAPRALVEE